MIYNIVSMAFGKKGFGKKGFGKKGFGKMSFGKMGGHASSCYVCLIFSNLNLMGFYYISNQPTQNGNGHRKMDSVYFSLCKEEGEQIGFEEISRNFWKQEYTKYLHILPELMRRL